MVTVPLREECYMLCFGKGRERFFFDSSSGYEAVQQLTTAVLRGFADKLILEGPSGCGKTLLLKGLVKAFQEAQPDKKALLLSADKYTSGLVSALKNGTQEAYAESLGANDLLIVDDTFPLAGKPATQTELCKCLHIVGAHGGSVILSLESMSTAGEDFAQLFKAFFWRSMTLRQPGRACRAVYAADMRRRLKLDIPDEVLQYFADKLPSINKLRCAMSIYCMARGSRSAYGILKLLGCADSRE